MHDAAFRRSINKIVEEKYDGDVFAYIKNLHETIDTLESNMDNMADAYLHEDAA